MERKIVKYAALLIIFTVLSGCGGNRCKIENIKYNGWSGYKLKNDIIQMTIIPSIGGRVMEYGFENNNFIFNNPEESGNVYDPTNPEHAKEWHNFGGYKTWVSPQAEWIWPPQPLIDFGTYNVEILKESPDTVEVKTVGPEDTEKSGIQFIRYLRIYKGTSRVRVDQVMKNVSNRTVKWGIWDVTQVRSTHGNSWVYAPMNPKSKFKKGYLTDFRHVDFIDSRNNPQWRPNVVPGIMGVKYLKSTGKIGIDSNSNWIVYVDKDDYVYVKRFEYFPEGEYPDYGSSLAVYTTDEFPYLEVEVCSPMKVLKPGKSYSFTIDWYATRCPGPIVDVNELGVVNEKLHIEKKNDKIILKGKFGVFYQGYFQLLFKDVNEKLLKKGKRTKITPQKAFNLERIIKLPKGTKYIELNLRDNKQKELGILGKLEL